MAGSTAETLIGAVVVAAAGGFLFYAAATADISVSGDSGFQLVAEFRKAEGLNTGGDVRIAGVKVGTVRAMELDPESYRAVVTMSLREGLAIPEDSSAKITAAGLLGDNFIAIEPGASDYMLAEGDRIQYTQGSVNLLDMAGKLIHGSADGGE
jgi:phospholipid/cholesterol/gamma-HCH transport system substrate-binding protein